jgi:hypothetical protein
MHGSNDTPSYTDIMYPSYKKKYKGKVLIHSAKELADKFINTKNFYEIMNIDDDLCYFMTMKKHTSDHDCVDSDEYEYYFTNNVNDMVNIIDDEVGDPMDYDYDGPMEYELSDNGVIVVEFFYKDIGERVNYFIDLEFRLCGLDPQARKICKQKLDQLYKKYKRSQGDTN